MGPAQADDGTHPGLRQIGFTIGVIALGAKMARVDGEVSDVEVAAFRAFFQVPPGTAFSDDYIDRFPIHYGEFKAFFLRRQIKKLAGLSQVVVSQIDAFKRHDYGSCVDSAGLDEHWRLIGELTGVHVAHEQIETIQEIQLAAPPQLPSN